MLKVKASSKGQVVIPKPVRDAVGIVEGTELAVEHTAGSVTLRIVKPKKRYSIDELIGCLPYRGRPKTIEEMNRAVEKAVRESWARRK